MKTIVAFAAIVLLASSTASAAWIGGVTYAVPGPVVYQSYMPVAPYYAAYPTPYYTAYPAPVYAAPQVVYRPAVVAPPVGVYSPGVVVYPRVFVPGQPVRNVLRATLP